MNFQPVFRQLIMLDISRIRESYSKMLDSQLIDLAITDGHNLTPEALQVLREEFSKRNISTDYIEAAENTKAGIHQEKMEQIKTAAAEDYDKLIWNYILEEVQKGTPDNEIMNGLKKRGLPEEQAYQLLAATNDKIKAAADSSDTKMLVGGISFLLGTFITLITYTQAKLNGGVYFITWGAIVFGAVGFFKGLSEKNKFRALHAKRMNSFTK